MKAIDNLINGNLEEARRLARRPNALAIIREATDTYGFTYQEAVNVARFKCEITWGQYCQEKHAIVYSE